MRTSFCKAVIAMVAIAGLGVGPALGQDGQLAAYDEYGSASCSDCGSCDDCGCDTCDDCGCDSCDCCGCGAGGLFCAVPGTHLAAGAGLYFYKPHFGKNRAFTVYDGGIGAGSATDVNFNYDMEASPLIWASYAMDNGLGVRGRFFTLDTTAHRSHSMEVDHEVYGEGFDYNIPGEEVEATSRIEIDEWDLEAIAVLSGCPWSLTASAGVRYMYLRQTTSVWNSDSRVPAFAAPSPGEQHSETTHTLDAFGPTMSLEGQVVGSHGLGLYAIGRGSLLFADALMESTQRSQFGEYRIRSQAWDAFGVLELETGLLYAHPVAHVDWFTKLGLASQFIVGSGNASFYNDADNLGLFGFRFSTGINF